MEGAITRRRCEGALLVQAAVEHCDDVWVCAESAHGLGFTGDARTSGVVKTLSLYQRKRDLAVQQRVVRLVDAFFAALAEELADPVTVVGERGLGRCR